MKQNIHTKFVSSDQVLCCPTKFCVVRQNFASSDKNWNTSILCRPTWIWSSDQVLSGDTKLSRWTKKCVFNLYNP
jgi:hypothetical protein